MNPWLTKDQYAREVGASKRTVERWLKVGALPADAVAEVDGKTMIMSGTPRPTQAELDAAAAGATSRDVARVAEPVAGELVAAAAPIAVGGTLAEFAAMTGCSPSGVRRLFEDVAARPGLPFYVGRYGPHGALRAVAFPRG